MNNASTDKSSDETQPKASFGGLIAILAAIVIGALVGVFYGESMWMASGGPSRAFERLEETEVQKEEFAVKADERAEALAAEGKAVEAQAERDEATRLRNQIPTIQARADEVAKLVKQAEDNQGTTAAMVASIAWEFTDFVGDLFLQVLKLLVIPLVVTSMICGITSLGDVRKVGRVGLTTIVYYMATTTVAVIIGIGLVQMIQPGTGADDTFAFVTESVEAKEDTGVLDTLLDVFRGHPDDPGSGMFPSNIFQAASSTNVLALIVFAILFGGSLTTLGSKGNVAIQFFDAANEAVMKMVHLVMFFAPVGIYGLVAGNIARNGGGEQFAQELNRLGWYVGTVLLGLLLHAIVLAVILMLLARRNPITYTYNILRALLTAVSTSSSSATLPVTMECVEENNGVSNRAASFVLPLGATINMDGTALYEAVAVIFIAQSLHMQLAFGKLVVIFLTATLAAVGAAGIPEAGLVTMVIVLQAAGIPMSGIGTILAIDWFLDRLRTTVNVYGDAIGAAVIDHNVVSSTANATAEVTAEK